MSFTNSCLRRADGDQMKADYLFDCSYFEYYYRLMAFNKFIEEKNEEIRKAANTK